ncbi:MAG: fructose-bisphosphate aldolase [bacterium]
MVDLAPISRKESIVMLAYDQGFEIGPSVFNSQSYDPKYIFELAIKYNFSCIALHKGIAEKYYHDYANNIPLVIKLNGKTSLSKEEPISRMSCSVDYAKFLGAKAVGATIYLGSEYEDDMLEEIGKVQERARQLGLPFILWAYPKAYHIENEFEPGLVEYAARIGLEIGADVVKVKYPHSKEANFDSEKALSTAVKMAGKCKLLVAGGPKMEEDEFISKLESIKRAGAYGLAVGRNVWNASNLDKVCDKINNLFI